MSLYSILGIPEGTSDKGLIRKMFRKKARDTHPDHGGATEAFTAVAHAYRVLSDDSARAHYDKTGDEGAGSRVEDPVLSSAINLIGAVFTQIVSTRDLLRINLPKEVVSEISARKSKVNSAIDQLEREVKNAEKALSRLTRKKQEGEDYLAAMLRARIGELNNPLVRARQDKMAIERALEMLDQGYEYQFDAPAPSLYGDLSFVQGKNTRDLMDEIIMDMMRNGPGKFGSK